MKMVEKYKEIHRIGVHCEAVAVRDIIQYYGTDLTIHDLFGVSGIMATICCEQHSFNADLPYLSISGYTSNITLDAAVALGLEMKIYNYDTFENTFRLICNYIDREIPVIVRLAYNIYAPEIYDQEAFPEIISDCINVDFGVHFIQILEYDDSSQTVYFADGDKVKIQSMSVDLLRRAMNAEAREMPSVNEFMVIMPPAEPVVLEKDVIISSFMKMYLKTSYNFNFGNHAFVGERGVLKFYKDFLDILETCDETYIRANAAWILISIGGLYDSNILYKGSLKRYCDTAYKSTGLEGFVRLSKTASCLEKRWRLFSRDLHEYLSTRDLERLKVRIADYGSIVALEQEFTQELKNTLHSYFYHAQEQAFSEHEFLSHYMNYYGNKGFSKEVCYAIGCGLQFQYESTTGVISPLRKNVIERFLHRFAFVVRINCLKEDFTYLLSQIKEYIRHDCIPILCRNGRSEMIIGVDENDFICTEDYQGVQKKTSVGEIIRSNNECRVLLIESSFHEGFPAQNAWEIILRSALHADILEYGRLSDKEKGLGALEVFYDDYCNGKKYEEEASFYKARKEYADFLAVLAERLGDAAIYAIAAKVYSAAKLWCLFHESGDDSDNCKKMLRTICDTEREICNDIKNWLIKG